MKLCLGFPFVSYAKVGEVIFKTNQFLPGVNCTYLGMIFIPSPFGLAFETIYVLSITSVGLFVDFHLYLEVCHNDRFGFPMACTENL